MKTSTIAANRGTAANVSRRNADMPLQMQQSISGQMLKFPAGMEAIANPCIEQELPHVTGRTE